MLRYILSTLSVIVVSGGVLLAQYSVADAAEGPSSDTTNMISNCDGCSDYPYDREKPKDPPAPVVPPVDDSVILNTSDEEDNRRISDLLSCCIRGGQGGGSRCSVSQLNTGLRRGEVIRTRTASGGFTCTAGTGVVSGRSNFNTIGSGQSLASPFSSNGVAQGPAFFLNFLFGN